MADGGLALGREGLAIGAGQTLQVGLQVHARDYHQTVICNATPSGEFTKRCKRDEIVLVDIQDARRKRLQRYIERQFSGNISALARRVGRQPTFFSDLFAGRKSFGEKLARKLESELGLEPGYFDRSDDAPSDRRTTAAPQWPFRFAYERWTRLTPQQQRRIEDVVEGMILAFESGSVPSQQKSQRRRAAGE